MAARLENMNTLDGTLDTHNDRLSLETSSSLQIILIPQDLRNSSITAASEREASLLRPTAQFDLERDRRLRGPRLQSSATNDATAPLERLLLGAKCKNLQANILREYNIIFFLNLLLFHLHSIDELHSFSR